MRPKLQSRDPPKTQWVSLTAALTWLVFDHAFELAELLDFADAARFSDDDLRQTLCAEWERLADYACYGTVRIRARDRNGYSESDLNTDHLRNFRFVEWKVVGEPFLTLEQFPCTFSGGFRQNVSGLTDWLRDPVVWRRDLETYKRFRRRTYKSPRDASLFKDAKNWLRSELSQHAPQTGLRLRYLGELETRFSIPKSLAQAVWTEVTRELGWPLRGRPKKST